MVDEGILLGSGDYDFATVTADRRAEFSRR